MSERRTLILAVVFAALGAWVFVVEGFRVAPPTPEWERGEKIVDCSQTSITALEIVRPAGNLAGRKSGGRWATEVGAERRDRASLAFEDLARSLCELPIIDRITEPGGLADYGLERPQHEIRLELGERRTTLDLGTASPAQNLLYARFRDKPEVLQVGVLLRHEVEKVLSAAGG